MGRRRRRPKDHDAHDTAATTSKGPRCSRLGGDDVQRSTTLTTRRRLRPKVHDTRGDRDWAQALKLDRASSHFIADEAWRRLFPSDSGELSRRQWGSRFACSSFSRISLFFSLFGCVRFGIWFVFLRNFCFFFFFLPLLVPVFGCSENVEKKWEFGFWLEF